MPDTTRAPQLGDIDPETFRAYGKQLIDWIADYLTHPERYPVLAQVKPGEVKAQLPPAPPAQPESLDAILDDFQSILLPGITHWNHPNFYAYFANTGSMPGILGELLTAALNVNAMLWRTSPAATELEEVVLNWLLQMLGLPATFEGVITDTASASSMLSVAAAREALDLRIREAGMAGRADLPRLRMYCSEHAHSSVEKAGLILGLGRAGVRKIPVDAGFRMRADALAEAIDEDLHAGWRPFYVAATVGTTSSTSIDPVPAIADLCARQALWLHVDAAYGGSLAVAPEFRHILAGCERADSFVVNPHKWLFTPLDFSAFYVRDADTLTRAFSLLPDYLRTAEGDAGAVRNYMDYGVQLGRRFRALKFWMIVRTYGVDGMAARLREHVRLAQLFAAWVDAAPDFERLAPTPMSTVCFRASPAGVSDLDPLNEALMNRVNATGKAFLSHTRLNDHFSLRLAIGNIHTAERHVRETWELLQSELKRLV